MSARTAEYLRVMMTPRSPTGDHIAPHRTIEGLSRNARHLWEVLSNLAYATDNTAVLSVETLARRMGVKGRMVQRARAELVAAGVIAVDVGGGDRLDTNRYRFPLGAPVEVVPTGVTGDTGALSTPVSPVTLTGVTGDTHQIQEDPPSTDTYAIDRGAPAAAEDHSYDDEDEWTTTTYASDYGTIELDEGFAL